MIELLLKYKFIIYMLIAILLTSCTINTFTLEKRTETLNTLIKNREISKEIIYGKNFNILSLKNENNFCKNINIYIEGDGLAWITRTKISTNPTPLNPISLKLMLMDDSCSIYLARPCQYVYSARCDKKYWTSHRFNSIIIDEYVNVMTFIKKKYRNKSFSLIGFSGGAAIASLVANKRNDIKKLTTIAGNLDIDLWSKINNVSKLYGSLNPINYTDNLQEIEQFHLIGNQDKIIPKEILFSYLDKFENKNKIKYKIVDSTHNFYYFLQNSKILQNSKTRH